jgi:tetratricopeptide (TPR) repeat protein
MTAACAGPEPREFERSEPLRSAAPAGGDTLRPVTLPDLSRLEPSVQAQIRDRYAALERLQQAPSAGPAALGEAYGEVGKVLMAAEFSDLAEPSFLNARAMAPGDHRWPYYLAHIYRTRGLLPRAAEFFNEALARRPDDVATLVWLGELQLAAGHPDAAEALFGRALALDSQLVAARFGLGRAAVAKQDHRTAIEHLEAALALDREALNVHYPLAMAYRGLGDLARAEAHLRQQGKFEILPPDPLMQELRTLLASAISYELQGTRELTSGHYGEAAQHFRRGLTLDPSNPSLRHKLGTALHMLGQPDAARQMFEQVVKDSPEFARAQYSLGVLLESDGRRAEALERYAAAVMHQPGYAEARMRLAGLLRVLGEPGEALAHYEEVLATDPRLPEALFGSAMALIRLRRYQDARTRLEEARRVFPDQPGFAHALARLLAAAPEASVRDGRGALALMNALPEPLRRLDMGETMAMALAEAGQYRAAAMWQREAMAAARSAGNEALAQRMAASLRLYEAGQPCRTPWRNEDMP